MAGVHFQVTGDANGYIAATRQAEAATGNLTRKVESEGRNIDALFKTIAGSAAAFFSLQQVDNFRQKLIEVRGEFQSLEIAFTTMLQSEEKSVALMAQLTDTAAKTPFGLKDVSNGAKQLIAYGVAAEDVNDTIIRLGNIASGLTIPLNDLVYLYGTTMTQGRLFTQDLRQFQGRGIPIADELAKQFGVTKDKVGELVTAGKVGFPEVQKAIQSMTNEGGKFFQLMEKQSGSLAGMRSNLEDSIDMMLNEIGKDMQGALGASINLTAKLVENYKSIGQAILDMVVAFGAYKAAVATIGAVQSASSRLSYAVEIDELGKLIPLKKASANADVESAAASGMISRATAEKVIAMRAEAAAYVEELKLIADKARQELTALLIAKRTNAEEIVAIKAKIAALREQGKTREADALSMRLQSLEMQKVALASQVEAAQVTYNTATTNANTAAQNLNSVSNTTNAKTTGILTLAKMKLATAFKAVGDAIKANPVMLFATAVAAAVTVVYKLATAANTSEAALEAFNSRLDDIKEASNRLKDEAEGLIRTIQDETQTSTAQMDAYKKLSALFPDLTKQYSFAALAALDLAEAQRLINLQIESTNTQKLKDDLSYWQQVANGGFFKRVGAAAKNMGFWSFLKEWDFRGFAEEMAGNITKELSNQLDSQAKAEFESKTFEAKMQIRVEQQSDAEANMEKARQDLLDWAAENQHLLFGMELPVGPEFDAAMAGKTESEIRAEQDRILTEWESGSYGMLPFQLLFNYQQSQEQFEEAKNYVEQLKAEQQSGAAAKNYGKAYREAETAWKNAKKTLEDIKKNRDKYTQEDYDKAVEKEKDTAESFKALGGDTTKNAQNEAKKRAEAIRKAEDAEARTKKEAKIKAQREQEDIENEAEQASINALADGAEKRRRQRELDNKIELQQIKRSKEDFIDAYVEREKAIFDAEEEVNAAKTKDYQKKTFDEAASRAKAASSEGAKKYDVIYSDTQAKQQTEGLEELRSKYEDFAQAVKRIDSELAEEMSQMKNADGTLVPGFSQENIDLAVKKAEEAKDALAVQYVESEEEFQVFVQSLADKTIKELEVMLAEAEKELSSMDTSAVDPDELAKARAEVAKLKEQLKALKVDKGVKESEVNWTDLNKVLGESADKFSELGEIIPGITGQTLAGIGSIATAAIGVANGITAIGKAVSAAEKASAILAVVSAVISVIQKLTAASEENAAANEAASNAARDYSRALDEISYAERRGDFDSVFGSDNWGEFAANVKIATEQLGELQSMLDSGTGWDIQDQMKLSNKTSGWGTFSKDLRDSLSAMHDLMDRALVSDMRSAWQRFWGTGNDNLQVVSLDDFIDEDGMLDSERLRAWYEAYGEGLTDEQKNIVEDLLAGWDSYYETLEQMESYISGLFGDAIGSIADKWIESFDETGSAITDLKEISNDFAKSFAKDMLKNMLATEVFNDANTQAMLDLIKSGDMEGATAFYNNLVEQAEALGSAATGVIQSAGVQSTGESTRSATEAVKAQATQESITELNGRATAIQSHTFSINERVGNLVSITAQILGRVSSIDNKASRLETIERSLDYMRSDISDILTKGIKVKA